VSGADSSPPVAGLALPRGFHSWQKVQLALHEDVVFRGPVPTSFSIVSGYKDMASQALLQGVLLLQMSIILLI
jgi:hypothetical protein